MISYAKHNLISLTMGAFLFVILASEIGDIKNSIYKKYDELYPVVTMTGDIVKKEPGTVTLAIQGEKHRACNYVRIQAYTKRPDGSLQDAYIRREDRPESGDTKPPGKYDIGHWKVWPIDNSNRVVVYVQHNCNDRIVYTKIADIIV